MTLAKLMNESDRTLAKVIAKFEGLSGYASEDVRMLADIRNQAAAKIASLGLDPADTTGEELYHALQSKLKNDAAGLAADLDFDPADGVDVNAAKLIGTVRDLAGDARILALRPGSIKELLRQNPPKKVMKRLNYRSVDSMLKRGDLEEIMAAADIAESSAWVKSMVRTISKLSASSFEIRSIKYLALSSSRWADLASRPVTDVPLCGVIAVWPSQIFTKKESLYLGLTILQAAEIIETDDFYLRQHQFEASFGRIIGNLFLDGSSDLVKLDGTEVFNWAHIRKLATDYEYPLERLAKLHPSLAWWQDTHSLALLEDDPVSMNLGDNLRSLFGGADYKNRHQGALAHRLRGELLNRYGRHQSVKSYIASQFNDTFITIDEPAFALETVS